MGPPPTITPPPPTPPKKRRGWMIVAIIALALLAVSFLLNIGHALESMFRIDGAGSHAAGPRIEEMLVEDNDSKNKIAVISIDGIITSQPLDSRGSSMVDIIKAELDRASSDKRVVAVLMKVDSPGGEVLASDDIAKALEYFQNDSEKPVIVSMGSLAASGGYYVSAPCRWIVANELTITGSIGVIMEAWNYRALMDKVGLKPFVFKSGAHKDMLSGTRELTEIPEDERAMLQAFINQAYTKFTSVITNGRQWAAGQNEGDANPLVSNWRDFADGRILSGEEARKLGLVDQVGDFDDAVDKAIEIAGVDDANVVEYRQRRDLGDLFGFLGESQSRAVKIDLGVRMPELQPGRCYFIWPTYLR
jgi:protease IV